MPAALLFGLWNRIREHQRLATTVHTSHTEVGDINEARWFVRFVSFRFHFNLQDAAEAAAALRCEHDAVADLAFVFESDLIDVSRKKAQGRRGSRAWRRVFMTEACVAAG